MTTRQFLINYGIVETAVDEILGRYAKELAVKIKMYHRDIDSDQFSHQEDAYYAGLDDAAEIILGEMD